MTGDQYVSVNISSLLKPLASSAITEASLRISSGSQVLPTAMLLGKEVAVIPALLFLPTTPWSASPHTSYLLIPRRGTDDMVLPSSVCFSSGVIRETRSAALSSNEKAVFR